MNPNNEHQVTPKDFKKRMEKLKLNPLVLPPKYSNLEKYEISCYNHEEFHVEDFKYYSEEYDEAPESFLYNNLMKVLETHNKSELELYSCRMHNNDKLYVEIINESINYHLKCILLYEDSVKKLYFEIHEDNTDTRSYMHFKNYPLTLDYIMDIIDEIKNEQESDWKNDLANKINESIHEMITTPPNEDEIAYNPKAMEQYEKRMKNESRNT